MNAMSQFFEAGMNQSRGEARHLTFREVMMGLPRNVEEIGEVDYLWALVSRPTPQSEADSEERFQKRLRGK